MPGERSNYDDMQAMFLLRLARLMKLRERMNATPTDSRAQLVDLALRSTLRDCAAVGVGAEAHALMETD